MKRLLPILFLLSLVVACGDDKDDKDDLFANQKKQEQVDQKPENKSDTTEKSEPDTSKSTESQEPVVSDTDDVGEAESEIIETDDEQTSGESNQTSEQSSTSDKEEVSDESFDEDMTEEEEVVEELEELVIEDKPFDVEEQKKAFEDTRFLVLDVSETEYDKAPSIAISFSVPLDITVDYADYLEVEDDKRDSVSGSWVINESQTRAYFSNIDPNIEYKVIVRSGIKAITGKKLTTAYRKYVKTKSLNPKAEFASKGQVLPLDMTNGLAVESVNVKMVDIDFHRVNDDAVVRVIRDESVYARGVPNYSKLVYSGRYELDHYKNKRMITNIPVHNIDVLKEPGLYVAVMKPAGEYPYDHETTSFYISDLALQLRSFPDQISVHAMKISSGEAESEVEIQVFDRKGASLEVAETDSDGNYRMSKWPDDSVVMAKKGNNFAVMHLASPSLDLSDQLKYTRQQLDQELFLYGPRDLYRPGEMVTVNGLLRDADGELTSSLPLKVELIRPDGKTATSFNWYSEDEGFYSREIRLDKSHPTGKWLFKAIQPGGTKVEYAFSVEDFMPETMKLTLKSSEKGMASPKTNIKIKGQGDYLYGAPAAGNRISARIRVQPTHYPIESLNKYFFGRDDEKNNQREIELEDKKLDDKGAVSWQLPSVWSSVTAPTKVIFEASLYESGGRPITRRINQIIWPGNTNYGLRKLFKEDFARPFKNAFFELINADKKGRLHGLGNFDVSLIREDDNYYWRADNRRWQYYRNRDETLVYSRTVINNDKRMSLSLPVEYGTYRVEIKDLKGNVVMSYRFFAGWSWDESGEGAVAGARPDKVRFKFDKESYNAGEEARVTLISPYTGNALIRIESNKLLWEKEVALKDLETVISVPVSSDWKRHDLYISSMVVSEPTKGQNNLMQLPKRALGITPFRLDRQKRNLALEINSPEVAVPDSSVTIKVKAQGQTSQAYLTLAAVDTGVLSLSRYQTPDPFDWFYGQRAYSGQIRDSFAYLIKNLEGETGKLKFGGDAAELSRGGEQPSTDVQVVSLFSDLVKFDSNGEAEVTFDLPDFNGEVRLMALSFAGNQFGHQEKLMKIRAPVVAEISKPRFLALDDESQFAVDIQNMSGSKQKFTAEITIDGALAKNSISIPLDLEDKAKHSQLIDIKAMDVGVGTISMKLVNENKKTMLTKSWSLGIRAAYAAEFRRQRGIIKEGDTFEIQQQWVNDLKSSGFQARVEYSSMPPLNAQDHLTNLFQYPYGCLEQTSSRAWPLLTFNTSSNNYNLDKNSKKVLDEKDKHLDMAIQRILGMQRSDGSFGLWSNQSNENHWLSVYALEFLVKAKQSGYQVPQEALNRGLSRIKTYVRSLSPSYTERQHYSQNPDHYGVAFRAYAAYLLAMENQITLSELIALDRKIRKETLSGLPYAHMARAYEMLGDSGNANKFWDLAIGFDDYKNYYNGDYGSKLRDTAWIATLGLESKSQIDVSKMIFKLDETILGKRWFSTQERFAIYRLAIALESQKSKSWKAQLSSVTQQAIKDISSSGTYAHLLGFDDFGKGNLTLKDGEQLYIDLQIVGYPNSAPGKVSDGATVEKRYYDNLGNRIELSNVTAGDYVLVKLDMSSTERLPDALLVDMIPAGFELENPGLAYAFDFSEVMVDGHKVSRWHESASIKHQEYRDDRYVAAIDMNGYDSTTLFYMMRAVTAGTYQVPSAQLEDMYRPYIRSVSSPRLPVKVLPRQ